MRFILTLSALGLLLTACTTTSDASIRRHVVGVWSSDSQPGKVGELKSDGTVVVRINGAEPTRGKWLVSNGYLIEGPAEDWSQVNPSLIETNKVLSISGDKAVLLSIDGHTQVTLLRQ
jgi:hypothetical protein